MQACAGRAIPAANRRVLLQRREASELQAYMGVQVALLMALCAAAEERKPVSYKLKKGELDAPDPTPQRSEGQGDGEPDDDSDEEGNGEQAASEDSSEAEQDDVGAAGDIAQKEIDMQVQGLPFHRGGLCPCHASHCLCFLRTRCMSAGPHYVQPYPAVLQCDCGPHLTTVFLLGARSS